jgi:dethiobiotin synthetase
MTRSRFFVTGTDTGVGKTEVSAALLSVLARQGHRPFAYKPCESGGTGDSETLRQAAGGWQALASVCVYQLEAPLAPAHAARAEGRRISWPRLISHFHHLGPGPGVVEGAGGLMVPVVGQRDVIDLIEAVQLPVVLVARAGLGTINHTALSLMALQARNIAIAGVVFSQNQPSSDPSIEFNRKELEIRFPKLRFYGPVLFEPNPRRRRAAFMKAVGAMVDPVSRRRR